MDALEQGAKDLENRQQKRNAEAGDTLDKIKEKAENAQDNFFKAQA